jgi:RNA polymerase sigma-70 factor (ECF subfamily)
VFLSLFESDGKALRAWNPERGSSLEGFVSLLAQRQLISILRNGRTTPWPDDPTEPETLDSTVRFEPLPEELVASREFLGLVLDAVRHELSPRGLEIFQVIVVDQEPADQAAERLGLTLDAFYQWRSRLLKMVRDAAKALSDGAAPPRIKEGSSSP